MTYVDDAGQEHVLQATDPEVMCKFPLDEKWPDHDIEEQIRLLTIENKRRAKEYMAEKEKKAAYCSNAVGHPESSEDGSVQSDKSGDAEGVFEGDNKGEGGSLAAAPASD